MRLFGFALTFFLTLSVMNAQKVNSIYVKSEEKRFKNQYRNFKTRDSIVLYKDSTFRKEENYWGFDELDSKVLYGKWKFTGRFLFLKVEKRKDSSQTISLNQTQIISLKHLHKYKKTNY